METKKTLIVIIDNCEFSKEFSYYITLNLEGEPENGRTEISQFSKNPKFSQNKFIFELKDYNEFNKINFLNKKLFFKAFFLEKNPNIISQALNGENNGKILGDNSFNLSDLSTKLNYIDPNTIEGEYIKHSFNLFKQKIDKQIEIVGKLFVSFRISTEESYKNNSIKFVENDDFHILPEMDNSIPYSWRIRVFLRSAINLKSNKLNPSILPSAYVEIGWTQFNQIEFNSNEIITSNGIESNKSPIWNQEMLYYPPKEILNLDGYLNIIIRDSNVREEIKKIIFPISCLKPYIPLNADFEFEGEAQDEKSHLFISFVLEEAIDLKYWEILSNMLMVGFNFDPTPKNYNRAFIVMTTEKLNEKKILFNLMDTQNESSIFNSLVNLKSSNTNSIYISNTFSIPPLKLNNQYDAYLNYIIPKTFLDKNINFYLFVKDIKVISNHLMPNILIGKVESVQDLLKASFNSKKNEIVPFKFIWDQFSVGYNNVSNSRCVMEFSLRKVIDKTAENSRLKTPKKDNLKYDINNQIKDIANLNSNIPENEKWDVLSKELLQKQEVIQRLLKDSDERNKEILELKKQIKILRNENLNLKARIESDENQLNIDVGVKQEIELMNTSELKNTVLKMAQINRSEKIKNENLEKSLKKIKLDNSNAKNLTQQYNELVKVYQDDTKKMSEMQKNMQKIDMYKDTINKQEEVIDKYEKLLKKQIDDSNKLKESLIEIDRLKTDNFQLQNEIKKMVKKKSTSDYNSTNNNIFSDNDKYQNEIFRLENIIKDMQIKSLNNENNINFNKSNRKNFPDKDSVELEIKYNKSVEKINILENEIDNITRNFADEVTKLRLRLSEKDSILQSMKYNY